MAAKKKTAKRAAKKAPVKSKPTPKKAATPPAPVERKMPAALLGAINGAPSGRQRAMRRAWARGLAHTIDSVSVETLQAIKTDAGTFVAALIFECAEQAILDKLGVQKRRPAFKMMTPVQIKGAMGLKPETVERITRGIKKFSETPQNTPAVPEQPAQKRAARVLVHDAHLVVPLHTVAVGSTVKTPDVPDEGLEGAYATVVRQGIGSTTVRLGTTTRRVVRDRNGDALAEFDAPGRSVSWAPGAMVVVVAERTTDVDEPTPAASMQF